MIKFENSLKKKSKKGGTLVKCFVPGSDARPFCGTTVTL